MSTSGTAIRESPHEHAEYMPPSVRASFVKRVCLLGAESTGKTTLATDLAERFKTVWVPEYGHVYQALGRPDPHAEWSAFEFVAIARLQGWYEDFLAGYANRVLFCDTDVFTTAVWQRRLMGHVTPEVEELVPRKYDLYVLCDLATPFAQDRWALREDGPHRAAMDALYREHVAELGVPSVDARGSREERVRIVGDAVERLLAR